jgi:hypothetical protein
VEAPHAVADRLRHPLHLTVAALVEGELEGAWPEPPDARGRGRPVFELDALGEPAQRRVADRTLHLDLVDLLDAVARVGEPVREEPVVRQEQEPGRVGVEAADRHDARLTRHEVDDRRPALRVASRRDDAGRLVEQEVRERLPLDLHAVDGDDVSGADDRAELARPAVHRHPPGPDELVGAPPRGDARPG